MIAGLLLILICVSVALAGEVDLNECRSGGPEKDLITVLHLTISGCSGQPCTFVKGKTYTGKFKSKLEFSSNATTKFEAKVYILTIFGPVQLYKGDPCQFADPGECANIKEGQIIEKKIKQAVPENIPSFSGDVRGILFKDGDPIFCAEMSVKVENNPDSFWGKLG